MNIAKVLRDGLLVAFAGSVLLLERKRRARAYVEPASTHTARNLAIAGMAAATAHLLEAPVVSVVIPVWRDEAALAGTLEHLAPGDGVEVIVVRVLGEESRYQRLQEQYAAVRWASAPRGRGVQMNTGAALASGRWLLFLHADSALPPDWLAAVRRADGRGDTVAGAFSLALDSRDWRARLIEAGVRLRIALFGMPYGDQALFIRRGTFMRIGGYRDLPLMEDVDLVRRLRRNGRLFHTPSAVVTSARRWERDGWIRRSAHNVTLAARFVLGGSPSRLAQAYFGRKSAAVVMMARAPWTGGKTRLALGIDHRQHADLRLALFLDTLDVVTSVAQVEPVIACEPADASERVRELVGPAIDVLAQRGADLGQRMAYVFEDVFRLGVDSAVVIGSDLPDLPARLLREALAALRQQKDCVVLGPAADGGYYLIGMNRPRPELFSQIDWSTARVLAQTLDVLKAQHTPVVLLPHWADVDTRADLRRLMDGAAGHGAKRTRAWVTGNLA
jgi:rSAM/selenodomain-associated transferase 2/rSAM/selenodomain-associated transferase 1